MKTTAAILVATGKPLEIADLEVPALKPGQVLVEIAYSGVCHTQLLECQGHRGADPFLPHCLGHEASGTVLDIGADVKKCRSGDRVILSWIKGSGGDVPGCIYTRSGRPAGRGQAHFAESSEQNGPVPLASSTKVNAGGITTFMTHAVVSENRITPLDNVIPFPLAALIGCAAATGAGAVWNAARLRPGESLAVFGCGGVGLCAVAAGVHGQASSVVAIDVHPTRLQLAATLGAQELIDASKTDSVTRLRELFPGGLDHAIEASGRPSVMRQALACVRPRGGQAVIIGNARFGETLEIDPRELNQGKRLIGTWGGDCDPDRDFPRIASLAQHGDLPLDRLLGREYSLTQVNEALADLQRGDVARPLLNLTRT